jgi:hypothetical protein
MQQLQERTDHSGRWSGIYEKKIGREGNILIADSTPFQRSKTELYNIVKPLI